MGAMAVTFLLIIEKEYAILCVLMALLWGAAAVFFLRMAIGEVNPALVRWGLAGGGVFVRESCGGRDRRRLG